VQERFWREARAARNLLYVAVAFAGFAAAVWLALLLVLGGVVNQVFILRQTLDQVAPAIALIVVLAFGRAALIWMSDVVGQRAADRVKRDLRERLTGKLIALGPTFVHGERAGDLVHVVTQGVESLDEYITQYLPARLLAGLVPTLAFLLIALLDPWTLPILLFTGPLLLVLLALIGGNARELTRRREGELSWMSAHFLDMLQGLATLKMFGRSKDQAATIETIGHTYRGTMMGVLRTAFQTSLVLEWGAAAATALVAIEVSVRLMSGLMPFDRALGVLLITPEFFLPLRNLAARYHAGTAGKAGAERIYALLDTPSRPSVHPASCPLPGQLDIRFDDVSLAYDSGQRPALDGFSVTIAHGEALALVGASGAGKTTVANLLLRFVEPDRGTITVGGLPLRDIDPVRWRTQVAWVPQHAHLFHGTVADNLRLARSDARMEQIVDAARAAHAHDFIVQLPHGYDTQVGERGARLSGGQAQRIAIARAFLKDAPLLILDEPTSHLDSASENLIRDALVGLMNRRTVVIISHLPTLVAAARAVAVMADGRVIETLGQGARVGPDEPDGSLIQAGERGAA